MRYNPYIAVLVGVALFCGCNEERTPTEVTAGTPVFNFSNGPESPNPKILRGQDFAWDITLDTRTNLASIIGPWDVPFPCAFSADPPVLLDYQDVASADETVIQRLRQLDDYYVFVIDMTGYPDAGGASCANLGTVYPIIATGTVDAVWTDNDLYAYLYDHTRKNSWGLSAHGEVEVIGGDIVNLNVRWRCRSGIGCTLGVVLTPDPR
jgi:hypothetical protein